MPSDMESLTASRLSGLSETALREAANNLLREEMQDRREQQILFYQPVSEKAKSIHYAMETIVGVGAGNRASKTSSCLADIAIRATGIIPDSLKADYPREKLRGPINIRIVCESLTTTMHPVILHKLQWWKWNGLHPQGGPRGHWGWIPRNCLIHGSWEKSWTEKLRQLRLYYRDPDSPDEVLGESNIQIMSLDQDPDDFASGEFHLILHDEPPTKPIFDENKIRVMSLGGQILIAMTWPDDPSIPVDYLYDDVYEKGLPGRRKDPHTRWIELSTTENPNIDQEAVRQTTLSLTALQRLTRIEGKPIRFSHRIHPLFADVPSWWCFTCNTETSRTPEGSCALCGDTRPIEYCHVVEECPGLPVWPVVFLIDPHPRKPHNMLWIKIDPSDDLWVETEAACEGGPGDVKRMCDDIEEANNYSIAQRLMDPNMGASPSDTTRFNTWQTEFERCGVRCDLADDSGVGRSRLNDFLKPDPGTRRPRLHIHERCATTIYQLKRYTWQDDRRLNENRDIVQRPRQKNDDYPSLLKYAMNSDPNFNFLKQGPQIWRNTASRGPLGY